MNCTQTAISLNVADVDASAAFAALFGFRQAMSAEGFISLEHDTAGYNVIFLRTGLATFKPATIAADAGQGTLLVFVVDDLDTLHAELAPQITAIPGSHIITTPETEPWGERFSQYSDPNGIVWQLVQWIN